MSLLIFALLSVGSSQEYSNGTACYCECCDFDTGCEIPGSTLLSSQCTSDSCQDWCDATFTICTDSSNWQVVPYCDAPLPDGFDWGGKYAIQEGAPCLIYANEEGEVTVGAGCVNPCYTSNCACMDGDVVITQLDDNVTLLVSATFTPQGGGPNVMNNGTFIKSGSSGLIATGTFEPLGITYDIQLIAGTFQFNNRPGYNCLQQAIIDPSSTNWIELGFIIAGACVAALLICLCCFCNPLKKCRKQPTPTTPGVPEMANPNQLASAPYTILPSDDRRRRQVN